MCTDDVASTNMRPVLSTVMLELWQRPDAMSMLDGPAVVSVCVVLHHVKKCSLTTVPHAVVQAALSRVSYTPLCGLQLVPTLYCHMLKLPACITNTPSTCQQCTEAQACNAFASSAVTTPWGNHQHRLQYVALTGACIHVCSLLICPVASKVLPLL